LNEILSRALLRARLTDEDVAARLQVDPKTVRRWLEGRVPYLRYRWALALLVGMDESDLWPQLRPARPWPGEVVTVYAHRDSAPPETWVLLFSAARREIGVMADSDFLLDEDSAALRVLAMQAAAGVRVRVCLPDPAEAAAMDRRAEKGSISRLVASMRVALGQAEFRLHRVSGYNPVCYADSQVFVFQQVFGVRAGRAPVLNLRGDSDQEMIAAYLDSFEQVWANAQPVE